MQDDRAQATLLGLVVAMTVLTTLLLAGVSISTAVIDQQVSMGHPTGGSALDGPCVRGLDHVCVDPSIRLLPIEQQPHRVDLRAGIHLVGISPQGAHTIRILRIDGETVLADPEGLDGVYQITAETPGNYTLTTDGDGGVIRLRAGVR